ADLHHAQPAHSRRSADDQEQSAADQGGEPRDRAARRRGQGPVGDPRPVRLRQRDRGAGRRHDVADLARARVEGHRPLRVDVGHSDRRLHVGAV
ncbi:MAG: hypothetical protein AVDCRST_MAG45-451, partial [uncultured Solirubrobacterales bacterium]